MLIRKAKFDPATVVSWSTSPNSSLIYSFTPKLYYKSKRNTTLQYLSRKEYEYSYQQNYSLLLSIIQFVILFIIDLKNELTRILIRSYSNAIIFSNLLHSKYKCKSTLQNNEPVGCKEKDSFLLHSNLILLQP